MGSRKNDGTVVFGQTQDDNVEKTADYGTEKQGDYKQQRFQFHMMFTTP